MVFIYVRIYFQRLRFFFLTPWIVIGTSVRNLTLTLILTLTATPTINQSDQQTISSSLHNQNRDFFLCLNCGELGHIKKKCPLREVSDEARVIVNEKIKEIKRIRRAEYRQTPENKKKSSEYERSPHRKELKKQQRETEGYKTKQKEYRERGI